MHRTNPPPPPLLSPRPAGPVRRTAPLLPLLLLLPAAALPLSAQVVPRHEGGRLTVGARVHTQLNTTSVEGEPSVDVFLRRIRVTLEGRVDDWIDGVAMAEFGEGEVKARYAFLRMHFGPGLRLSVGQFKRAFDLFELTSSSQILVVERTGRIRGVDICTGVGGLCSYSRLSEALELSSLDIGVLAEGSLSEGRLGYRFSATNGAGDNVRDPNGTKSLSGRLTWGLGGPATLGANLALHDYTNPVIGDEAYAPAGAVDFEWGGFDRGLHVQAGVMLGENWRALTEAGEEARFVTTQGIVTWRFPLGDERRVVALEPVGRLSWADPSSDVPDDAGFVVTPGLVAHFAGRNKVAANVDVWLPREGETQWSLKMQTYFHF